MARIVIDRDMNTTYITDDGKVESLGQADYAGIARRNNAPLEAVRRMCLNEMVYTFVIEKAADFDAIETPDGVFYRCPDPTFTV